MPNPDDFARKVREMRDAATPGPWQHDLNGFIAPVDELGEWLPTVAKIPGYSSRDYEKADAAFIAALPDIANAFLRQHEECKRLEARVNRAIEMMRTGDDSISADELLDPLISYRSSRTERRG